MNDEPPLSTSTENSGLVWAPLILAAAVLAMGAYLGMRWWQVESQGWQAVDAIPADAVGPPLTEFELTERSGAMFRSEEMRGKVWAVSFFFTSCPGACVQLNQSIADLQDEEQLQEVTWVSITCDPATDTPAVLSKYAAHYEADPERWLFCCADLDYTKRVGRGLGVEVYQQSHKTYVVLVDKQGGVRGVYDAVGDELAMKRLKTRLRELIDEPFPT